MYTPAPNAKHQQGDIATINTQSVKWLANRAFSSTFFPIMAELFGCGLYQAHLNDLLRCLAHQPQLAGATHTDTVLLSLQACSHPSRGIVQVHAASATLASAPCPNGGKLQHGISKLCFLICRRAKITQAAAAWLPGSPASPSAGLAAAGTGTPPALSLGC